MAIDLALLRLARAVAQHGHFGRAARSLGMTQPSLSRAVQSLERRLGVRLFDRGRDGTVPTDAGRVILEGAEELLLQAEALEREIDLVRGIGQRRLVIGAGPYPAEMIVAPAIAAIAQEHPGLSIELRVETWDALHRALRARAIEVLVAETSTLRDDPAVEIEPLGRHPLHFVVGASHPLANGSSVGMGELFAHPFVAPSRIPPRILSPLLQALGVERLPRPVPSIECVSIGVAKAVVHASTAFTALPMPLVAPDLERRELAVVASPEWLHLDYGAAWLRDRTLSPAAGILLEGIRACEASLGSCGTRRRRRAVTARSRAST